MWFLRQLTGSTILLICAICSAAYAGERLEFEAVQPNVKERISITLHESQALIKSSANTQSILVFQANKRQLHIIDHQKKTIASLDQNSVEQIASVAESIGELAKAQGGVLGDLFKTFGLDNTLGSQAVITTKIQTGERRYAGMACENMEVYSDEVLVTILCLTDKQISSPERQTLHALFEFAQLLANKGKLIVEQFNLAIPVMPNEPVAGIVLHIENVQRKITASLKSIANVNTTEAQFQLPENYAQTILSF